MEAFLAVFPVEQFLFVIILSSCVPRKNDSTWQERKVANDVYINIYISELYRYRRAPPFEYS